MNYSRFYCVFQCKFSVKTLASHHKENAHRKNGLLVLKMLKFRPYKLMFSRYFTPNDYLYAGQYIVLSVIMIFINSVYRVIHK